MRHENHLYQSREPDRRTLYSQHQGFGLLLFFIIFLSLDTEALPLIAIIAVGGFLAGYLVMPRIIKPDIFSIGRAIATGCLTTFGAAFFGAAFFVFMCMLLLSVTNLDKIWQVPLGQILDTDLTFSLEKFRNELPFIPVVALALAIPYSFIGVPATISLSYCYAKYRAKKPKFDLETFE